MFFTQGLKEINTKGQASLLLIMLILLLIVLGFGYVGGQEAKKIGVTCDIGVNDTFCWKWHKNVVGEVQEVFENTGQTINDFFEDE